MEHSGEPCLSLAEGRALGAAFCHRPTTGRRQRAPRLGRPLGGWDHGARPPACGWGKKRATAAEVLGRSQGGFNTKVHLQHLITVQAAYAKNGEARSVPMNDVLTMILKAIRMNTAVESLVFCNHNGAPYTSFRAACEKAVQKAGLADFRFHDLRHPFASRLVMSGVDLPTVKELLGHKDISMTLRYTYLSTDHKQDAVRLLEQFGEKVPAIFTIGTPEHPGERLQVIEKPCCPLSSDG